MPSFLYSELKTAVNGRIHNKIGLLADARQTINNGVRDCLALDLRSTKRKSSLAPNLFNEIYQYTCPTDLKAQKIISLQPQTMVRDLHQNWELTAEDEFDRRKDTDTNLLAFSDRDFTRKLLISYNADDNGFVVSTLDALTGGGSWALFGDGTNLTVDNDQYVKGSASINWDISAAGGTTAGIQATDIPTFDLTDYASAGSVFVWAWVTSATNLTNYILRIGSDSSNYYSMTATTTNEGLSFAAGWNLLRFDFSGKSTTGTPDDDNCDYAAIYMTKTAGKISETDYRFDHIIVKKGQIFNLIYYSKYLWQNSSGTYLEDSTADTDVLNVDTEEYNMLIEKCTEWAAREARETEDATIAAQRFASLSRAYRKMYKSERLPQQDTYYYL